MTKISKLSMVALLAMGTSAFAGEVTSVDGGAKFWYETGATNKSGATGLFNASGASSSITANLGIAVKGKDGGALNARMVGASDTLIDKGTGTTSGRSVNGSAWVSDANVTMPLAFDTAMVAGRMELPTPFAFSEKWNNAVNTFDAMLVKNTSIKDLVLVAAWVATGNSGGGGNTVGTQAALTGTFAQLNGEGGVYAAIAHSKLGGIAADAYYYNFPAINGGKASNALWLNSAIPTGMDMLKANVIVASMMPDSTISNSNYAVAADATMKIDGVGSILVAGSMTTAGAAAFGNAATGNKKSMLPTEGVYTDGLYVAQPDVMAVKAKVSDIKLMENLAVDAQYVMAIAGENKYTANGASVTGRATAGAKDANELDVFVKTKVGAVNLMAIYMLRMGAEADLGTGVTQIQYIRTVANVSF